jgi:hypothetical protein
MFVIYNVEAGEKILLAREVISTNGQVSLDYKLLNSDLSVSDARMESLPIQRTGSYIDPDYLSSSYQLGVDSKVYIETSIGRAESEIASLPKGASRNYKVITVIDTQLATSTSFTLSSDIKNHEGFTLDFTPNGTRFIGFFCDLKLDENGKQHHGIYSVKLDKNSNEMIDVKYTYFDQSFLDELLGSQTPSVIDNTKNKAHENMGITSRYKVVEDLHRSDNGNLALFCTRDTVFQYAGSVGYVGSGGNIISTTGVLKKDILVFELNNNGELVRGAFLRRTSSYIPDLFRDVRVTERNGSFSIFYDNEASYYLATGKKLPTNSNTFRETVVEYATLDFDKSSFEKHIIMVDEKPTSKQKRREIETYRMQVINNAFYVYHFDKGHLSWTNRIITLLTFVVPPAGFIVAGTRPFPKIVTGNLGRFETKK